MMAQRLAGTREQRAQSWRVTWQHDGIRERRSFRHESEAIAFQELLTAHGGTLPAGWGEASEMTVAALYSEWAARYARGQAVKRFATMAEGDPFAKERIADVTEAHVSDFIERLSKQYAEGTVRQLVTPLKAAFRYAVKSGYLAGASPFPARIRIRSAKRSTEAVFLRDDEAAALVAAMPAEYRLFVRLLLASGLRIGEAYALRVYSVNVRKDGRAILEVERSYDWATGKLGQTKTAESRRSVPLPMGISTEIAALAANRHFAEPLFTLPTYKVLWLKFQHAQRDAGLLERYPDGIRIHDLRHTYASRLLARGMSLFQVSKWLGHSSIEITANLYGKIHVDDERLNAIVDTLEA